MKLVIISMSVMLSAFNSSLLAMRKPKSITPIERFITERMRREKEHNGDLHMVAIFSVPNASQFQEGDAHNTIALDISNNKLPELVKPFKYPHLLELDCSHNCLTELPEGLFMSRKLEHLFCSSNAIKHISTSLWLLSALCVLDLSSNQLQELPKEVCSLNKLKMLNVAHNKLKQLPKAIDKLQSLEVCNIKSNPINQRELTRIQLALPVCNIVTLY